MVGEFSWGQWLRAAVTWFISTPAIAFVLLRVGAAAGAGGWWPVIAVLGSALGSLVLVAAGTWWLSRYETPYAGLAYLRGRLRAELAAPRPPDRAATGPVTHLLDSAPLSYREAVTASKLRSECVYLDCKQSDPHEAHECA